MLILNLKNPIFEKKPGKNGKKLATGMNGRRGDWNKLVHGVSKKSRFLKSHNCRVQKKK